MRLEGGCLDKDEVQFMSESWRNALYLLPMDAHGRAVIYKDKRRNNFKTISREGFVSVCVCVPYRLSLLASHSFLNFAPCAGFTQRRHTYPTHT